MIISPPFLPKAGLAAPTGTNPDPMMDAVDERECDHGVYPIAFDRRWHCGMHLQPTEKGEVYAIADGEVVAYRVCQHAFDSGTSHIGFVLLKHTTETGEGRTLIFYSLYMHLLPLVEYRKRGADKERLPEFLRMPTGPVSKGQVTPAVSGEGNKVRRKDVLGWLGQYEGMPHLHFEIFMLPEDFDAYFGGTQLGNSTPTPPNGTDWWGHAYFVIPAGSNFRRLPEKADARNKLHGIEFKPGHEGSNTLPLLVETYFSVGSKYTNVWSLAQDGTRTLLTPLPVEEKDYEYDLYKRATALYSSCPSDGYELLRFGRILSPSQTLAADARATWMQINWAAGKAGYIDINDLSIQKFSDADFLSLMGWQKINEGNTPFDNDGMCDVAALKEILDDAAPHEVPAVKDETPEIHKERVLWAYVKGNAQARQQLRGFVCNAPSEWDSTNNEERYARLLDEGGFYHGNDKGYNDFMKYLKEVQFWNKTGLSAGQKLWFFHPLAFIRHFRRCGWLSKDETAHCVRSTIRERGREVAPLSKSIIIKRLSYATERRPANLHASFYIVARKYGISSSRLRLAHLFGQLTPETGRLEFMLEGGEPSYFDKYEPGRLEGDNLGNTERGDGIRFKGRGLIQVTGRYNYKSYGKYRGTVFDTDATSSLLVTDSYNTCDASGWYWASKQRQRFVKNPITRKDDMVPFGKLSINYWADQGASDAATLQVTKCINPAGVAADWRKQGFNNAWYELNDEVVPNADYKPVM
ncbi:M23 family metallopeptidase [Burkholderia contaminans]|uniref:M23 family metallopeptidase n=1 Tax=Burkholderia contaminans TaxID=488447 RepID=UPI001CF0E5A1|nr:M23 family metallopeptidase [Burkholderia contaminans]MCA7887323.1 M23 family metallopeptidase [Burkholderia contaminans]